MGRFHDKTYGEKYQCVLSKCKQPFFVEVFKNRVVFVKLAAVSPCLEAPQKLGPKDAAYLPYNLHIFYALLNKMHSIILHQFLK
jgi:hypothetical protein